MTVSTLRDESVGKGVPSGAGGGVAETNLDRDRIAEQAIRKLQWPG